MVILLEESLLIQVTSWADHKEKFKRLNQPDPSYHGVIYTEALGEAAFIGRARVVPLRNTGAAISPFNAFLILQGVETLPLRMDRITENTLKIAEYLKNHSLVSWVKYAGLEEHPDYELAKKYLNGKPSGLVSFGINGGKESGAKFQDALKLITRLVNIGDAKTLACHPAVPLIDSYPLKSLKLLVLQKTWSESQLGLSMLMI